MRFDPRLTVPCEVLKFVDILTSTRAPFLGKMNSVAFVTPYTTARGEAECRR
jgi:hypothetical protein